MSHRWLPRRRDTGLAQPLNNQNTFIKPWRGKGENAVLSASRLYDRAETQGSRERVVGSEAAARKGQLLKGPKYQALTWNLSCVSGGPPGCPKWGVTWSDLVFEDYLGTAWRLDWDSSSQHQCASESFWAPCKKHLEPHSKV